MTATLRSMIEAARPEVPALGPAEACDALNRGDVDLTIDVREPGEFEKGHVPDAVNIPRGILELRADPASPNPNEALARRAFRPRARLLHAGTGLPLAALGADAGEHGLRARRGARRRPGGVGSGGTARRTLISVEH